MKKMLKGTAPAKINLTLEVLGRREDGYHALASVFHTLHLADEVRMEITPADRASPLEIELEVEGFPAPADSRNSVWQAIARFWEAMPFGAQVRVWLHKCIPMQAGLGGGSSDAATVLRLLANWAHAQGLPVPDLQNIAESVGSDVPFFLRGGCAYVSGRGEHVEPLPPLPPFWWVLAKPPSVGVPTGWAYAQLRRPPLTDSEPAAPYTERLVNALKSGAIQTPDALAPYLHNDFEAVVLPAFAELKALAKQMERLAVLRVLLCGSGATLTGLCHSEEHALHAADALQQQGYWSVASCLVGGG
ncbi:MAG: 4-(cytidine 5'-diphospho)-2-C-methyl-D-erythritol kinase [Fimbriimonadales bacterium]